MATNYESQKGFYENVKLDENGYLLVTGISGGGGATGPAGTSGSSGTSGTSGQAGTSGTSPAGGASPIQLANTGTSGLGALYSPTIGATISSDDNKSIAIGANAVAAAYPAYGWTGEKLVALGSDVIISGRNSVGIGSNINSPQTSNSILIGTDISAYASEAIRIGHQAAGGGYGGHMSIGYQASAVGNYAIAIGFQASPVGHNSICISGADYGIISGSYQGGFYQHSMAIGTGARFGGNRAISIGDRTLTLSDDAIAIGSSATASHTGSVALGSGMTSSVSNHTHINSLFISSVPVYADNSAAISGGLIAGQVYRTSTGVLMITY
jgi:hypothetical protein